MSSDTDSRTFVLEGLKNVFQLASVFADAPNTPQSRQVSLHDKQFRNKVAVESGAQKLASDDR